MEKFDKPLTGDAEADVLCTPVRGSVALGNVYSILQSHARKQVGGRERAFARMALIFLALAGLGQAASWRAATESELKAVIPARAPVEKERIETEFRTASGITDGKGKFVAGVVLITAGYSADGKYSHFFLAQAPVKIGGFTLKPGDYVFGFRKNENSLTVKFYDAQTGALAGTVEATRASRMGRIESFRINPPGEKPSIEIGRFAFPYAIAD